jgi:hypothetical protein
MHIIKLEISLPLVNYLESFKSKLDMNKYSTGKHHFLLVHLTLTVLKEDYEK